MKKRSLRIMLNFAIEQMVQDIPWDKYWTDYKELTDEEIRTRIWNMLKNQMREFKSKYPNKLEIGDLCHIADGSFLVVITDKYGPICPGAPWQYKCSDGQWYFETDLELIKPVHQKKGKHEL